MTTPAVLWTNSLPATEAPLLSLCVICGDSGVLTLERMLESVCRRRTPLVDEVIVFFNGKSTPHWESRLRVVGCGVTPITVYAQEWPGRFDVARAESFEPARGEWVLWLDTDDKVADPENPVDMRAIENVFRDYNQKPTVASETSKSLTLKQWLGTLPPAVNCVLAPYNYTEEGATVDSPGVVLVRQLFKRIVRRGQFQWHSLNGLHEQLLARSGESAVTNLGFLVRHSPIEDSAVRVQRNRAVVLQVAGDSPKDARHAFDIANLYIIDSDWEKADAALRVAISLAQNHLDAYRFRLARAGVISKRGLANESPLQEIFAAIQLLPDAPGAYFLATEAFFVAGQWRSCVTFFELGRGKPATPTPFDQPMATFVQPRVQAALAYAALDEPEKGRALLAEAESRYADSPLVRDARVQLEKASAKKRAVDGLLALAAYLREEPACLRLLRILQRKSVLLRGVDSLPDFQQATATGDEPLVSWFKPTEEEVAQLPAVSPWSDSFRGGEPVGIQFVGPADSERVASEDTYGLGAELAPGRYVVTKFKRTVDMPQVLRGRTQLDLAFYAPIAMESYGPEDTESKGLGGSEGSVIYLARELAQLGHHVDVYFPSKSSIAFCKDGVTYYPLQRFDAMRHYDAVIACRAPWLAREAHASPVFAWHQDNGYSNPWMWSDDVCSKLAGNLYVSKWAAASLARELTEKSALHSSLVLGNGLCRSDFQWPAMGVQRAPHRVLYASDPSRGLAELLDAWPTIHAHHPDAELVVACGFRVTLTLAQEVPGIPQLASVSALAERLNSAALGKMNVRVPGWISHPKMRELMAACGVYAYPGGPMPEGYGVALAQAQAAGCDVVYPRAGALPEVLGFEGARPPFDPGDFTATLNGHLNLPMSDDERATGSAHLFPHRWDHVAERLLAYLGQVLR